MPFLRATPIAGPKTLWADLKAFFATRQRHQLLFATISIAIPILIVLGFNHDTKRPPRGPEIVYIQNWSPNRTDADIIAQQKQELAERQAAQKERQRQFRELKKAIGPWL